MPESPKSCNEHGSLRWFSPRIRTGGCRNHVRAGHAALPSSWVRTSPSQSCGTQGSWGYLSCCCPPRHRASCVLRGSRGDLGPAERGAGMWATRQGLAGVAAVVLHCLCELDEVALGIRDVGERHRMPGLGERGLGDGGATEVYHPRQCGVEVVDAERPVIPALASRRVDDGRRRRRGGFRDLGEFDADTRRSDQERQPGHPVGEHMDACCLEAEGAVVELGHTVEIADGQTDMVDGKGHVSGPCIRRRRG